MWIDRQPATAFLTLTGFVLISLLAPFLGGSTEIWAQGIIAVGMGFLVMVSPPRRRPPLFFCIALAGLVLVTLAGFLPLAWTGIPAWREVFTRDAQLVLPPVWSPQPWATAESWTLLAVGGLWIAYLSAHQLSSAERWGLARFYVSGVTLLALLALGLLWWHHRLPFWHAHDNFGFFPNRNQMGNWLALSAILIPALIYQDWGHNRILSLWWLLSLVVIGTALVETYSRAGVLLFFGGTSVFLLWIALIHRSVSRLALGLSAMALLLTLFLIFGGGTLDRLQQSLSHGAEPASVSRAAIHQDALELSRQSPFLGVGLGNFGPVFALNRQESRSEDHAVHPESDWLWLAVEGGWIAAGVTAAGLMLLLAGAFPLERGTDRALRLAAWIGVIAFAGHGWMDVPGHRLGTLIPAGLLVLLMLHPGWTVPASALTRRLFQYAGVLVLMAGLYAIAAETGPRILPCQAGVARLKTISAAAVTGRDSAVGIALLDTAAMWAPLDWEIYFRRAVIELPTAPERARLDFLRARVLEPNSSRVPYREGYYWLPSRPAQTVSAWREAISRNHHNPAEYLMEMLDAAGPNSPIREDLKWLALSQPDLTLVFLSRVTPAEFPLLRAEILARDPQLGQFNTTQKEQFLKLWSDHEGAAAVLAALTTVPSWQPYAWPIQTADLASHGDYKTAYELAHAHLPAPVYPVFDSSEPMTALQTRILKRPADFAAAYLLINHFLAQNQLPETLPILRTVTAQPNCPGYFYYLEAETTARLGKWDEAWPALQRYAASLSR